MNRSQGRTREWWNSARIGKQKDARIKITAEQRGMIKRLYEEGESIRSISRRFDGICSRRLIQFVLFPERRERVLQRARETKRWEKYNRGEVRKLYMRQHRKNLLKAYGM